MKRSNRTVLVAGAVVFCFMPAGRAAAAPLPGPAALSGTVSGASDGEVVLLTGRDRRTSRLDKDGHFAFAVDLAQSAYAEVTFASLGGRQVKVYLRPGQALTVACSAADACAAPRFTGAGLAENDTLSRILARYDRSDAGKLRDADPSAVVERVSAMEKQLEAALAEAVREHPGMDPEFLRLERARIRYWSAWLRTWRLGIHGPREGVLDAADFNDPRLLMLDQYRGFLGEYVSAVAKDKLQSDPKLTSSSNQATEARYAAAAEFLKAPEVRNAVLYDILLNQLTGSDSLELHDGPFGCKDIGALVARFDSDCLDSSMREDIAKRYRQCADERNAPAIRPYKTVGAVSLDAHIFPAQHVPAGERRPAFVFFHGGGWAMGLPEWGYGSCRHFAERGFVAISFEYRLSLRHGTTPRESVEDANSAVRWVREHAGELGVDPKWIVVSGFSAGAHLATATAVIPELASPGLHPVAAVFPTALVSSSGCEDVTDDGYVRSLLAGKSDVVEISPAAHVRSGLPPAILFHGTKDDLCPYDKSEAFCRALQAAGNRCELVTFQDGGHFRKDDEWAGIDSKTDAFLASVGFPGVATH